MSALYSIKSMTVGEYISRLFAEGKTSDEVIKILEREGYEIVYGGFYSVGVKSGRTIYYNPEFEYKAGPH
jgi:hypothetical protein